MSLPKTALEDWIEEYDSFPNYVTNMQEFTLYCNENNGQKKYLGQFANDDIVWKTQREIFEMAMHIGSSLVMKGLKPGDRVGVYSENRMESVVLLQACHLFGFVSVFTFDSSIRTYPRFTLYDAEVSCIYISSQKSSNFDKLFEGPFTHIKFIIMNEIKSGCPYPIELFNEMLNSPIIPLPSISPTDDCTICYSSGTVGAPKGVVLSNKTMINGVKYIKCSVPVESRSTHVSFLPIAHILERIGVLIFEFRAARIVFASNGAKDCISDMKKAQVSGGPIIPMVLSNLHKKIIEGADTKVKKGIYKVSFSLARFCRFFGFQSRISDLLLFNKIKEKTLGHSLKWFAVAGDVFDKEAHEDLLLIYGASICPIYGLSEFAGPLTVTPEREIKPGTVGRVLPHINIKFGEHNEIMVKSETILSRYWKNEEILRKSYQGEWFRTGDRGEIDNNGHLIVTGRAYDICEFEPGVELAIPFLRFTYRKYELVGDIFIKPLEEFNSLIAIIYVQKNIVEHYFRKTDISQEEYCSLILEADFIEWMKKYVNEYGAANRLNKGSELAAIRLTAIEFSAENGFQTATGKFRVGEFNQRFQNEIESMILEIRLKKESKQ